MLDKSYNIHRERNNTEQLRSNTEQHNYEDSGLVK